MEAGYDYLLLRDPFRRSIAKYAGICLIVVGVMLLASGGVYYGYAAVARADLDELNATAQVSTGSGVHPVSEPGAALGEQGAGYRESPGQARLVPHISVADIGSEQLYPGDALDDRYWSNPWAYEPLSYREAALLRDFTPVDLDDLTYDSVSASATRLIVPGIDVDSSVKELGIIDLGGSRAYETPADTIGHIPETANAGEKGSSWFFGHTESPIGGEGSVFFNLGEIAEKLRNGEDVFIIADNGEQQFLYRVTSSEVVAQEDLKLYDTGEATIHLVSCVPRWVYDHRLIVTGELVAQKNNL